MDHSMHGTSQPKAGKVKDPVCGMTIDPAKAATTRTHEEKTFYFCSTACAATFDKDPHSYAHK